MIDDNLRKKLADLGTAAGARVYVGGAPEKSDWPLIILRRTGGTTPRTLGNVALFSRANITADVWATNYPQALGIANAVRDALAGFTGTLPPPSAGTTTKVHSCRCTSEPTDVSEVDGDRVMRGISQEFAFVYQEN